MAQFFDDIEEWNRSIEEMFEFVAEISWITLMYNDDMDNDTTDTWIRYYIFHTYNMFLKELYRLLCSVMQSNNLFYSILKAQLRENLIRRIFRRFENHHAAWQQFNLLGFRETIHYPLIRYQEYAEIIRNQIIHIHALRDIFLDNLESGLIFYETTQFEEETIESWHASLQAFQLSRIIRITVSDELQELLDQQLIFHIELIQILRSFNS